MENDPITMIDTVELLQYALVLVGGGAIAFAAGLLGCIWWVGR